MPPEPEVHVSDKRRHPSPHPTTHPRLRNASVQMTRGRFGKRWPARRWVDVSRLTNPRHAHWLLSRLRRSTGLTFTTRSLTTLYVRRSGRGQCRPPAALSRRTDFRPSRNSPHESWRAQEHSAMWDTGGHVEMDDRRRVASDPPGSPRDRGFRVEITRRPRAGLCLRLCGAQKFEADEATIPAGASPAQRSCPRRTKPGHPVWKK